MSETSALERLLRRDRAITLIGLMLLAEGFDQHIPKGYIYFAIAFSIFVEMLNLRSKGKSAPPPVQLHQPYVEPGAAPKA